MNEYEEKQEARRQRLLGRAQKARNESTAAYKRSNSYVEMIPMGQPILIGHHSERGHRAALRRSHAAMSKSVELDNKANRLEERAASVGKGGISSDDPDAVVKLKEKLEGLEAQQDRMKKVNRAYRSKGGGNWEAVAALGVSDQAIATMKQNIERYSWERQPYAKWQLSNNLANIKRIKARIAELEDAATVEDVSEKHEGFEFEISDNRVRFYFPSVPSGEVRSLLKRNGFRWAPSVGAWQRQASKNGRAVAEYVLPQLKELMGPGPKEATHDADLHVS